MTMTSQTFAKTQGKQPVRPKVKKILAAVKQARTPKRDGIVWKRT